jgi:RimJ/RimL family protein N-acetyltransferase
MAKFKCLYYFTSPDIDVMEIQRTDLPEGTPLSDIYKWLILKPLSGKVIELDFKSMDKNEREDIRTFVEGEFRFDSVQGHLTLLRKDFYFDRKAHNEVPVNSLDLVRDYLIDSFKKNTVCSFRSLKPSDVNYFKKWILDKEVIRYSMTKFHRISNDLQIIDWFQATLFDGKTFQLGIVDPESGDLIGYAGIASLNEVDGNGEYFIFIGDKIHWGKGIASFATKEILRMGFKNLKLHRIFLTASSSNPGAIRAYEKAGFVHEGRMREAFYRDNEYSDKVFMGILQGEFERGCV